ncbi:hypothetical protein AB0H92_21360 [Streptomyces phaeochromogenes]|uniref:hypothetical protein n=1 Tax=Streptomyces phaeochromogenes TaxID=1923 RepID=UPI0033DF7DD0
MAAGVAVGSQALSSPAHAVGKDSEPDKVREAIRRAQERNKRVLTGTPSTNGWEMEKTVDDHGHIYTGPVPATPLDGVQMRPMGHADRNA